MQKFVQGACHYALTRGQTHKKIGTDEPNYGKVNSTFPAVLHFLQMVKWGKIVNVLSVRTLILF
jgi:hypothetical protein